MVDKKELRVGNIILREYSVIPLTVMEIKENTVRVSYTSDKPRTALIEYENLAPICLTHEILEKLPQFTEYPFSDEDGCYFEWCKAKDFCLLSGDNNDVYICDSPDIRFKYLHQLQNLIYTITGNELEIKL